MAWTVDRVCGNFGVTQDTCALAKANKDLISTAY